MIFRAIADWCALYRYTDAVQDREIRIIIRRADGGCIIRCSPKEAVELGEALIEIGQGKGDPSGGLTLQAQ
jgi:hypothetical protein